MNPCRSRVQIPTQKIRDEPLRARYRRRIIDDELDELLAGLPAVALDGPKAVGKTATALRRAETVHRLDNDAAVERRGRFLAPAGRSAADPDRCVATLPTIVRPGSSRGR